MYLVIIGWMYVVAMMAVAEATSSTGTLIGAFFTFVLYGAAPVALAMYLLGGRRKRDADAAPDASDAPDRSGESSADAVPPVRKEP